MLDLVYQILAQDANTTSVVGSNIFPEFREPTTGTPAIMVDLRNAAPIHTGASTIKAEEVEFLVNCYAPSVGEVMSLSRTVQDALGGLEGTYSMPDGYEYNVANSSIESYEIDSDYDGRLCACEILVSFHLTH